jgi:hypothetical protein
MGKLEINSGNAQRQQRRSAKLLLEIFSREREVYDDEERRLKKKTDNLLRREQRLEEKISDMPFINWCCLDFFLGDQEDATSVSTSALLYTSSMEEGQSSSVGMSMKEPNSKKTNQTSTSKKQVNKSESAVKDIRKAEEKKERERQAAEACKQAMIEVADAWNAAKEEARKAADARKQAQIEVARQLQLR